MIEASDSLNRTMKRGLFAVSGILYFLICGLFLSASSAQKAEAIPLITYHTHMPFVASLDVGLSYDLASYLNRKAAGRYRFEVRVMSRPRVNLLIAKPETFVVPWVNPAWFQDKAETNFLWTQNVLMKDQNAVVSRLSDKVIYTGPDAFVGRKFGGVRGHHYAEVDDYIMQTKGATRIDSDRHLSNLRKLMKGRIDVTIMPASAANYFIKQENLSGSLFVSPRPHSSYNRRMFVNNEHLDLRDFLDQAILAMAADTDWQAILDQYR